MPNIAPGLALAQALPLTLVLTIILHQKWVSLITISLAKVLRPAGYHLGPQACPKVKQRPCSYRLAFSVTVTRKHSHSSATHVVGALDVAHRPGRDHARQVTKHRWLFLPVFRRLFMAGVSPYSNSKAPGGRPMPPGSPLICNAAQCWARTTHNSANNSENVREKETASFPSKRSADFQSALFPKRKQGQPSPARTAHYLKTGRETNYSPDTTTTRQNSSIVALSQKEGRHIKNTCLVTLKPQVAS